MLIVMTVAEYIENDLPFYHITFSYNKDNIIRNGLLPKICNAICTIRSDERIVWDNVIATQIPEAINQRLIIIKLLPSKHGIGVDNVAEDSTDEPTKPLQNYIADIPRIVIDESDIICDDYVLTKSPGPVPECLIERLKDYKRKPIPDISNIPNY